MAVKTETFNQELFDLLKTKGYNPRPLNSVNQEVNPELSDVFAFKFSKNGKNFGTGRVSIDDMGNLILYTNDQLEDSPESNTSGSEYTDSWTGFKKHLRSFAKKRMLNFEIRNEAHLHDDMKKRTYMKKKENVIEGYYPIGKKASYSDSVPEVKMIIQHTRTIEEGEQRYRNVARIFVENTSGERFLLPTKRPGIAKVYARHIAEGGTPYDDKGKHITSLVEEYTKMAGFVRATKNGQFNESAQRLVNEGVNHYQNLRETLSRMISTRGYHKYFDNYTPVLNEETDDATTINELFVQETVDPRIESVMPILARLSKNITEMSEVKELDQWAQNLVNETLELSESHDELKDSLHASVMRRIMNHHPALLKDLDNLEMAIDDAVSWFVGDGVEEVGSSDISAIVNDVRSRMEERHADIDEGALGQGGHKVSDKPYVCVHAKKGKFKCHAETSYEAAQKAAKHWGLKNTSGIDAHLADVTHTPVDEAPGAETLAHNQGTEEKNLKAFGLAEGPADEPVEPDMDADDKRFDDEELDEDLDANQKRVGQLGPTDPVGKNEKNLRGKLVGASESVELDALKTLSGIK